MKLLFPTVVHEVTVKNFKSIKKDLVNYVYEQKQRDSQGVSFSNVGGWQSGPSYSNFDNILLTTITETLIPYFSNNVLDMSKKIQYNGLWMNINRKGDYNKSHIHPDSHLSGVFWIKCPPDSGHLTFQSPHYFSQYNEVTSYTKEFRDETISHPTYNVFSEEGRMIIFPSSLYHHVEPNKSDEDRISVSFNINLVPKEGYVTS